MKCQVSDCAPMFKSTSTMAKHLKRKHNLVPLIKQHQPLLSMDSVIVHKKLPDDKQSEINDVLAKALAASSAPYSLVKNKCFEKFCN